MVTSWVLWAALAVGMGQAQSQPAERAPASGPIEELVQEGLRTDITVPQQAAPGEDWPFVSRLSDFPPIQDLRDALEAKGVAFNLRYAGDLQTIVAGGAHEADPTRYAQRFNAAVILDTAKLGLWPGGKLEVELEGTYGIGLAQSGKLGLYYDRVALDTDRVAGLDQDAVYPVRYFYQQVLDLSAVTPTLKATGVLGQVDTREWFDRNVYTTDYRQLFSNRALTDDPNQPRRIALAVILSIDHEWGYIRSGAWNPKANPTYSSFVYTFENTGQAIWVGEAALTPKLDSPNGKLPGNYRVGLFYNGQEFENFDYNTFDGALRRPKTAGSNGFYLSFDQLVWKENAEPKDSQGLGLFLRFSTQRHNVTPHPEYYAFGASYKGLIPTRDKDIASFGYVYLNMQSPEPSFISDQQIFEAFYMIQVFDWLTVTPGIQYLRPNDRREGAMADATVFGLKFFIVF